MIWSSLYTGVAAMCGPDAMSYKSGGWVLFIIHTRSGIRTRIRTESTGEFEEAGK